MAQREGEIQIEHRWPSPGLPEDMARRMGISPGPGVYRIPTLTCIHCKTTAIKNPFRVRERGKCFKCSMKYLCDTCWAETFLPDYDHTPFDKKVDLMLSGKPLLGSPMKLLKG